MAFEYRWEGNRDRFPIELADEFLGASPQKVDSSLANQDDLMIRYGLETTKPDSLVMV